MDEDKKEFSQKDMKEYGEKVREKAYSLWREEYDEGYKIRSMELPLIKKELNRLRQEEMNMRPVILDGSRLLACSEEMREMLIYTATHFEEIYMKMDELRAENKRLQYLIDLNAKSIYEEQIQGEMKK